MVGRTVAGSVTICWSMIAFLLAVKAEEAAIAEYRAVQRGERSPHGVAPLAPPAARPGELLVSLMLGLSASCSLLYWLAASLVYKREIFDNDQVKCWGYNQWLIPIADTTRPADGAVAI